MSDEPSDVVVTIRVPSHMVRRIEKLTDFIARQPAFSLKSKINRSDAHRYLLLTGIEALEQRLEDET